MKYFPWLLIPLLLFVGCGKSDSDNVPEHLTEIQNLTIYDSEEKAKYEIELRQIQVFEEPNDLMFGQIFDFAVDESHRVYISEFAQNHAAIHAFESDGSYITSIGGYGDGPGEFRSIISPQAYSNYLYTFDGSQQKINVYSLNNFSVERSIQPDRQSWSHIEELNGASLYDFTVLDSEKLLVTFLKSEERKDLLFRYLMNQSGEIISDTVVQQVYAEHFVHPDTGSITYSPFSSNGLLAISNDGYLYTVWTEEIFFKKHTMDGQYISSFYHPFSNEELSRDEVLDYNDSEIFEASVRNTGFPEYLPAIHSLVVDDLNNFWISTVIEDENKYEWWILSSDGEVLSKFEWPKRSDIRIVKNGTLYALETAPVTGLRKVVKYEFNYE